MVRAKKRGLDKNQKLRQMSQFFLARNFTLSGLACVMAEKSEVVGSTNELFDANASVDKSPEFECIRVVNSYIFF